MDYAVVPCTLPSLYSVVLKRRCISKAKTSTEIVTTLVTLVVVENIIKTKYWPAFVFSECHEFKVSNVTEHEAKRIVNTLLILIFVLNRCRIRKKNQIKTVTL